MTLQTIADKIDRNKSARADYVVLDVLKSELLPRFFGDIDTAVGDVFWRRRANDSITCEVGLHRYSLPKDFRHMAAIRPRACLYQLEYIGNRAELMTRYAEVLASDRTYPLSVYWIENAVTPADSDEVPNAQYEVVFGTKPDQAYVVDYSYLITPDLSAVAADVQMDKYVPIEYQYALISLGRADMISFRNGGDTDPYVQSQTKIYEEFLSGLAKKKYGGRNQQPVFAN